VSNETKEFHWRSITRSVRRARFLLLAQLVVVHDVAGISGEHKLPDQMSREDDWRIVAFSWSKDPFETHALNPSQHILSDSKS
jgi:hypothetical protein